MEFSFAELGDLGKCKTVWRPAEATFGPGCFPIVLYAPAAAAVLLALLRPALRAIYPPWLRVFADEEDSEKTWTVSPARVWTRPAFLVFALSLGSAVFAALASAAQSTPLFLIPLVPGLVSAGLVAATRPRSLPRTVMIINVILLYALLVASLALTGRPVLPISRRSKSMPPLLLWYTALVLQLTTVWTLSRMPLRDPFLDASNINPVFVTPDSQLRSPEDGFTLWNWMTFDWLAPIMATANRRQISEEDVWGLPISWQDTRLFLRLREMHGSLLWRVVRANARDIILVFVLSSVYACLSMSEITFLKQILSALEPATRDVRAAIAYSFLTFIFRVTEAQVSLFNLWHERRVFERVRAELIAALYEKALRRKAFICSGEHGSEDFADIAAAAAVAVAPTSIPGGDDDHFEPASAGDIESPASPDETTPLISSGSSSGSTATSWSAAGGRWRPWLWRIGSAAAAAAAGKPQARAQPPPPPPNKTEPFIPASAGMLFDLVKGDAYDVALRFWAFGLMTILLVRIILALYLLVVILGPSSFVGIGVVLGSQLVVGMIGRILTRVERRRRWLGDRKLQISVDFIQAIRHLRWYDWQEKWLDRILDARRLELRMLVVASLLKKAIYTVSAFSGFFFGVVAFYAYTVLAGHRLTADVAFPALGLFGTLNDALEEMPVHIEKLLDSWVAVGRIESFMREPDKEEEDVAAVGRGLAPPPPPPASPPGELRMAIRDGDFSWPGTRHRALHGVTVTFAAGLTVILGKVGAGKSALLNALLGEMDLGGGGGGGESQAQVQVPREMIGYCGQSPWLESLSIRDNILFCAPMDEVRYRQVLDACCLVPDLSAFPGRDMAHLGENGVGLSGGQRARVALARAVYSQSRILLLDDPIAALDHYTAETVLARLFCGSLLLKGRIVVFATHRTDLVLPHADQVIEVHHGRVRAVPAEGVQELLLRLGRGRPAGPPREDDVDDDEHGLGDGRGPDDATEDAIKDGATGKIIIEESRAHGSVLASVYWRYARYGSFWWWGMMLVSMVGYRAMRIFYFYFLKSWSESYHDGAASSAPGLPIIFSSLVFFSVPDDGSSSSPPPPVFLDRVRNTWGLPDPADNVVPWTRAFALITTCLILLMVMMRICTVVLTYISGKRLYSDILRSVSGAAFRFYDVTPVGRLINRLTSDLAAVDGPVPDQIQNLAFHLVSWLGSLVAIGTSAPAFLAIALAASAAFLHFFLRFFPTAQSLRRLEMAHLSPLFSNLGILIEGLVTVRAFQAEPHFQRRTFKTIDTFGNMDHFYWSCQNWLQYRYSLVSSGMTLVLSLYAVLGNLSQGTVGFVLSIAAGFISYTDSLCKAYGELQMQFVSVERLVELLDVEQEPEGDLDPAVAAAAAGRRGAADSWPSTEDDIVFDNVSVRYAPHLEPSLRGVTVRIPAGSSVAITGRTGSGKSTLALACLGTVLPDLELGGDIYIGGVSVTRVNKHALRSRVSFVAQDPVLFAGSMRDNLDPQGERSDEECAAILGRILGHTAAPGDGDQQPQPQQPQQQPRRPAAAPRITLRSRVEAGGRNLSQGQRQLVGLGRAILRRSAIVILDEATASIDARTATEMHEIMRTELAASTVITIAHRAEAVAGAEYVLEIAGGTVKEFRRVE